MIFTVRYFLVAYSLITNDSPENDDFNCLFELVLDLSLNLQILVLLLNGMNEVKGTGLIQLLNVNNSF